MRSFAACLAALLLAAAPLRAAELNPDETRWLQAAWPVIEHARRAGLPLDIVVQPQAAPGLAPLALAYLNGRCKLVLSMRGNPAAQAALERVEPALHDAALELMAAHELGHCLRHVSGRWRTHPDAAAPRFPDTLPAALRADYAAMHGTRLEEGFGDLAGLAWVRHARPAQYAALQRWLVRERAAEAAPGTHHDTLAWLRLAEDGAVFDAATPFERVAEVWLRGLATLSAP